MPQRTYPQPPETEVVTAFRVCCDGGEGALGHPRVWLPIPEETGWAECGYCDKRFVHADYVAKLDGLAGDGFNGPGRAA